MNETDQTSYSLVGKRRHTINSLIKKKKVNVHDLGAGRSAVVGVAGGVLLAQIAFGFGYATADYRAVILADTEDFAAKGLCGVIGILKIEFPTEFLIQSVLGLSS